MKVEVLIAETGEGACTGDRNARRAGERAHRLPALFEVRAGGEGRRSGQDERRQQHWQRDHNESNSSHTQLPLWSCECPLPYTLGKLNLTSRAGGYGHHEVSAS